MERTRAARLLGVADRASAAEVRRAFRAAIRDHHPDLAPGGDGVRARELIVAYRLLLTTEPATDAATDVGLGPAPAAPAAPPPEVVGLARLDGDTLAIAAPADETWRLLLDAAHDVGEVTYLDRSVPILEILCRFVDEPATSLVLTVQGRATFTEVFCTVESIEARPAPPTEAVVDVLHHALLARHRPDPTVGG